MLGGHNVPGIEEGHSDTVSRRLNRLSAVRRISTVADMQQIVSTSRLLRRLYDFPHGMPRDDSSSLDILYEHTNGVGWQLRKINVADNSPLLFSTIVGGSGFCGFLKKGTFIRTQFQPVVRLAIDHGPSTQPE